MTTFTLAGNCPGDPTAKQPLDHDDFTRRYRHAFTACMVEAGHVPCQWLRRNDAGELTVGSGALVLNRDGRPMWVLPEGSRDGWTETQSVAWMQAAEQAARLCEAIQ